MGFCLGAHCVFDNANLRDVSVVSIYVYNALKYYPLDRSKTSEFPLKVRFFHIITEPRNEESSEWIAPSLRILGRVN